MTEETEKQREQLQRSEKGSISLALAILLTVHEPGFCELLEYRIVFACSSDTDADLLFFRSIG